MDPGSLLGGAAVSYAIGEVLTKVVRKLHDLRNKNKILVDLTANAERLQHPVRVLADSVRKDKDHPAFKWLEDLQEQLCRLDNLLLQCSAGVVEWLRRSGELAEVDEKVSKLLQAASLVLEAERLWCLSRALTSGPPELRHKEICQRYSQFRERTGRDRLSGSGAASSLPSCVSQGQLQVGGLMRQDEFGEPEIRYGGNGLAQKLIASLVEENKRSKWFGLWAMGGAGKTFIAKEVFRASRIQEHFSGGKCWLTVSNQPEEHAIFLLQELWERTGRWSNAESLEDTKVKLKEVLNRDNVLLVLDDVWNRNMLAYLDVISDGRGGVILVTTRDENIFRSDENSRSAAESAEIHPVPPLSEEDSLKLFSWHAFGQRQFSPADELKSVAEKVVRECKGLPLALKVIGSAMGDVKLSRMEEMQGRSLRDKWEEQLARMRRADLEGDRYDALYGRLQLSVDHLREENVRLRDCFFSFAAYPEDYVCHVEDMASLWVAEGVVENNPLLRSETKAEAFLALLVAKSMIELVDGYGCKVHDVMRDLAFRNLRGFIGSGLKSDVSQWECLYEPGWRESEFPSQWTNSKTPLNAKRLSLMEGKVRLLPDNVIAGNLEVLLLRGNGDLNRLALGFFRPLSHLRVLDLSRSGIGKLSGKILRHLKSLVLLNLTNCRNLRKISSKLETLQNLEILRSQFCHHAFYFPTLKTLPKLTTLETDIGERGSRGFLMGAVYLNVSRTRLLEPHKNLKRLDMRRDGTIVHSSGGGSSRWETESVVVSSLIALEFLSLSKLRVPHGMLELHRLRTLSLWECPGELPALDELPDLRDLTLRYPRSGNRLPDSFGRRDGFPSLTALRLRGVEVESFVFHPMPMIETLDIKLELLKSNVPKSLSELHSLTSLTIMSDQQSDNLNDVFSDPDHFPRLRPLVLKVPGMRPRQFKCPPGLRSLEWTSPREEWPEDVVEREQKGELEVRVMQWSLSGLRICMTH